MITTITLTITHKKPISDLLDKVAGRTYTLDGVDDVSASVEAMVKLIPTAEELGMPQTTQVALDPQKNEWLPIESAPKDFVTLFDGWNGERVADVSWAHPEYSQKWHYAWCVAEYVSNHGWDNVEVKGLTHWMPLPQPPKEQA